MTGRSRENYNKNYLKYVNSFDPPTQHFKTCGRAFMVGGLICCIGQFLRFMLEFAGLTGDVLAGTVSVILIFLGVLLTGLGVYDRIGKNAGAGSIVPITGFANSVASPMVSASDGAASEPSEATATPSENVIRTARMAAINAFEFIPSPFDFSNMVAGNRIGLKAFKMTIGLVPRTAKHLHRQKNQKENGLVARPGTGLGV